MKTKSKNKKLRIALGICIPLIIIIAAALAVVMKYGPTFGFYLVPPSAERYGKDALATIGKNGIYSRSDEWKSTYEECLKMIENAESYEDTYPAIKKALSVCGGKHSMFMTKSESQDTTESYDEVRPTVSLDGDIAIIKLPDFLVTAEDFLGTAEAGQKYAKVAEDFIHENRDKIKGVVPAVTWVRWRRLSRRCCQTANWFIITTAATISRSRSKTALSAMRARAAGASIPKRS